MKNLAGTLLVVILRMLMVVGVAVLLYGVANAQESGGAAGYGNAQHPANAQGAANAQAAGNTQGPSQGLIMQRNLTLGLAKTIAEASLAACREKGYHTTVAVVDRAGQLLVILRDEQASPQTAEMARRKAYTARMFRSTTAEFQKRTAENPAYAAQRNLTDILALSGGAPIKVGDDTVGAVGSAGSTLEQDDACAKAGIAKVADQLK
jgi:uncharacterized protein GlcG (DUF336 family)